MTANTLSESSEEMHRRNLWRHQVQILRQPRPSMGLACRILVLSSVYIAVRADSDIPIPVPSPAPSAHTAAPTTSPKPIPNAAPTPSPKPIPSMAQQAKIIQDLQKSQVSSETVTVHDAAPQPPPPPPPPSPQSQQSSQQQQQQQQQKLDSISAKAVGKDQVHEGSEEVKQSNVTKPKVCTDTPGWRNGYTACKNYVPVDPDCTEDGLVCHFYKVHPHFCPIGMNRPWFHCCTCGGGSTFSGTAPTTTPPPEVHLPGISHKLALKLGLIKRKVRNEEDSIGNTVDRIYKGLQKPDFDDPPPLGSNPQYIIDRVVVGIVLFVLGSSLLAWLLQQFCECCKRREPQKEVIRSEAYAETGLSRSDQVSIFEMVGLVSRSEEKAHFEDRAASRQRMMETAWKQHEAEEKHAAGLSGWSAAMLITSYILLIPGLQAMLFSFNIAVNVMGHKIYIHPDKGAIACTESMTGLINLLQETHSDWGAGLVILYAMVVPGVKLVLLFIGEAFRHSSNPCQIQVARYCIMIVQTISKWACPDMFAYILLVHLVRVLNHSPLILTAARLDIGFSCFSVFCVCSTISALGVGLPPYPKSRDGVTESPPMFLRLLGGRGVVMFACGMLLAFLALFCAGVYLPCMALRIDQRQLYPPAGSIPYSAKPMVEALGLVEMLESDVSILKCIQALFGQIGDGDANSIFALIMFGVCVVLFSVADMLLLCASACSTFGFSRQSSQTSSDQDPYRSYEGECIYLYFARIVRKLAMLDVMIMGVYVITLCFSIYKAQGIVVSVCQGLFVLIGAEAVHTLTYWGISSAVEYATSISPETSAYRYAVAQQLAVSDSEFPDPDDYQHGMSLGCCKSSNRPINWPSPGKSSARGFGPASPAQSPRASSWNLFY
eukprot:TRINITY_DN6741_c0_g1_i2.p1 TRINITY_DN6741_c0_g1~~TRINITY_DN6741_c0_g1_i2.p1  ORF type:complete len:887 (-),score=127.46 TRINITY_DN6741_c0_g1_i2:313-2973(-)